MRCFLSIAALIILCNFSCTRKTSEVSSPISGEIDIFCDEALRSIVEQEEQIFERNYPHANVNIHYFSENELYDGFLNDSLDIIITTRSLDSSALQFLDQQKNLHPKTYPFAISAIAVISSFESFDSVLVYEDLLDAFRNKGRISNRKFVIENKSSGIARTLSELVNQEGLPQNFYALNSIDSLVILVSKNKDYIGFIDWSRVSDSDDQDAQNLLKKNRLVGISRPIDSIQSGFVRPYQYNLQDRKYPLTRTLKLISRSGRSDLGLGFASFITSEIGQRILLKAGFLPLYQTDRWIEIKPSGDIQVIN
ncbi:MAG: substrate-binding domain-containing protein [Saprospiraceae bacterium]|nr:substrate-binding domain-containing protein [Saprospiraceae bacterium]